MDELRTAKHEYSGILAGVLAQKEWLKVEAMAAKRMKEVARSRSDNFIAAARILDDMKMAMGTSGKVDQLRAQINSGMEAVRTSQSYKTAGKVLTGLLGHTASFARERVGDLVETLTEAGGICTGCSGVVGRSMRAWPRKGFSFSVGRELRWLPVCCNDALLYSEYER